MNRENSLFSYYSISESIDEDYMYEKNVKKKIITLGKCSRLYLYILGSGLFKMISLFILGDGNISEYGIGLFGFCPILYEYNFIQSTYIYLGYIIFGIFFFYFKGEGKKELENKSKRMRSSIQSNYIYNIGTKKFSINTKIKIFFACLAFVIHIEIKKVLYIQGFQFFNFWTLEIVFLLYLMKKYFIIDFYIHHKVSIFFIVFLCSILLLIASFLPTSLSGDNQGNSYQNINKKLGNYFYCILFILFFVLLSYIYAYSRTVSKVLMQIKFISPYKLIYWLGITGLIISLISASVAIFIDYNDNILNYFSSLKSVLNKRKYYQFYAEVFLVSPFYAFTNYMQILFEILTIYYLNPFYVLMTNNVYYIIIELISFLLNLSSDKLVITHFLLAELSEFFALLGYMVYLEILEFNFCGLSDYLKREIIEKGEDEFKIISGIYQFVNKIEEEEENNDVND